MDRDFDVDELLEKLEELRDIRDKQLSNDQKLEGRVKNIKYLGKMKFKSTTPEGQKIEQMKDVVAIIEEINGKDIEKVYTEDLEFLGKLDKDYAEKFIVSGRHIFEEEDKKEIKKLSESEDVIDLKQEKEKKSEKIMETMGTNKEETKRILKVNAKQELSPDKLVNDRETFGQAIGTGSTYKNIYVVDKEQMGLENNNTELTFIGEKQDGTFEELNDYIEYDSATGNRGQADSLNIDSDETAKENNNTISRYKVKGTNTTISVSQGEQGTSEAGEYKVYIGKRAKGENETVEHQVETRNVWPPSKDIREFQEKNEGLYASDKKLDEYREHQEAGEEETKDVRDVDGDYKTRTHEHISEETIDFLSEQYAREFCADESTKIGDAFTHEEVKEMIKNTLENQEGETKLGEIKEKIKNDISMDAERVHTKEH